VRPQTCLIMTSLLVIWTLGSTWPCSPGLPCSSLGTVEWFCPAGHGVRPASGPHRTPAVPTETWEQVANVAWGWQQPPQHLLRQESCVITGLCRDHLQNTSRCLQCHERGDSHAGSWQSLPIQRMMLQVCCSSFHPAWSCAGPRAGSCCDGAWSQLPRGQRGEAAGAGCSPRQQQSHHLEVQEGARLPAEMREDLKAAWSRLAPGYLLPAGSCWSPRRRATLERGAHAGAGLLLERQGLVLLDTDLESSGCSRFCS